MIAIYARQSLDKKDSISIDTQIEFCKKEIPDGQEYLIFQDKGFSGKNTSRPAFKQMLEAAEQGKISKIIVYRLDRISRSITDFSNIIDVLEENKVDFVSANEKFDTSAPVGRAMLYIIMVFAQLERETIAERIRDNYYARGKTGCWLGGPAPLGFTNKRVKVGGRLVSTIEPNQDIETIKEVFKLYANTGLSLGGIAKIMLNKHGVMWNNIKLSRILHNPAYVKADVDVYHYYQAHKTVIVNNINDFAGEKGCNLYGKRDRGAGKYRSLEELVLSIALHDGIIDSQTWLRCQYKLDSNKQIKNTGKGKHSWLTGLVKCGYCGYSMNVKCYRDKKYLNCTGRYSTALCIDKLDTHHVHELEAYVAKEMRAMSAGLSVKAITARSESFDAEANSLKAALHNIESQIENLIDNLATANPTLIDYANKKIIELDKEKTEILDKLSTRLTQPTPLDLPDLSRWETLDMELKREAAYKLISKAFVFNDRIEVDWKH